PNAVSAVLAEPEAILAVHVSPARAGVVGWGREIAYLASFRIELPNHLAGDIGQIDIVLGVGKDVIEGMPPARGSLQFLKRIDQLRIPCVGTEINALNSLRGKLAHPGPAIGGLKRQQHGKTLGIWIAALASREAPRLELLGAAVELRKGSLGPH